MIQRVWLFAAFAIVLVQAVPASQKTPLEIDEQVSYYIAHGQTPSSVWKRAFEQSATPPLSFWLVKASSFFGQTIGVGSREFWLRFPSLAAYLVSVCLVWRIVGREYGPSAASAAAVILALHSVGIDKMALQARPYAIGLMFALLAVDQLALLRCGKWCSTDASLLGIALTGLPWTHYLFGLLWIPAALQVIFTKEYAGFRGKLFGTMFLAGLWCLPLIPGALRVNSIGPALAWITEPPSWKPLDALLAPTGFIAGLAAAFVLRFIPGWIAPVYRWSPVKRDAMVWLIAWIVTPFAVLMGLATAWNHPSLAQLRYVLPTLGAAVVVIAQLFAVASGGRFVVVAALVYSFAAGHATNAWRHVQQPVWHDSEWKEAGELLKEQATERDLVFVQPGLVEAFLTPVKYADPGFQEYATSRLSDFYGGRGFPRLVVSLNFPRGEDRYLDEYNRRVENVREKNGVVWFVVSADTDLGELCQKNFEAWTRAKGFAVQVVRDNRIARILKCTPSQ
jgi:hypothetical protein